MKVKKEEVKNYSKSVKYAFFVIGVIATIAYRIILVLNFYAPSWVNAIWYGGTIGFVFYFGYLFEVQRRESRLVADYDLVGVLKKSKIKEKDKAVLNHVVKLVSTSKEKWNSLFISLLSLVALIVGILLDLNWISFA